MRKEVLLAILIGAGLGGAIAFGVWRANLSLNKPHSPTLPVASKSGKQEAKSSVLTLVEPEEGFISSKEKITIKGSSKVGSIVTVLTPVDNLIIEPKADGAFEVGVTLVSGVNEIKVSSFDNEGKESSQVLMVVYSTEFES